MGLWRGTPLSELDEHPRIVAARARLTDEWLLAQELIAEVDLARGPGRQKFLRAYAMRSTTTRCGRRHVCC
jgi:hypothetical protein